MVVFVVIIIIIVVILVTVVVLYLKGIPHSTISSALKYAPQIWYLAVFGRVFECA